MSNRLNMADHQAILGLARLNWSQRRIAAELGIDRQTVSRHLKTPAIDPPGTASAANAAMVITGSAGPIADSNATIVIAGSTGLATDGLPEVAAPLADSNATNVITGSSSLAAGAAPGRGSQCKPWRAVILEGLERGLTARRIWQDLAGEHGFAGDYQSVQRFVRRLRAGSNALPFRRMESDPGEEAQVDFGKGAPLIGPDGRRSRPHLFRIVLSCSRKAYSEAVSRQTTEQFIRCIENAFHHFGGVTRTLMVDNLKAAVTQADWYDPLINPKLAEFCRHYGTVVLPTRPYTPRHKGKIERGVGYAQSNALKGRSFSSLAEQNRFLSEWESSVADTRIHGTTRQQVGKMFVEVEKPALLPLPPGRFPCFEEAQRMVNRDGHVEVAKAYYSAPPEFVGRAVWARWDGHVVRLFDQQFKQIAMHAQHEPGRFATDARHIVPEKRGGIERGTAWWLNKASAIGLHAGSWAEGIVRQRGIHGVRVIIGLVSLTHRHPAAAIEQACKVAQSHGADRLRDIRNLLKRSEAPVQQQFEFVAEHPLIRSLEEYSNLVHNAFDNTPVEAESSTSSRRSVYE